MNLFLLGVGLFVGTIFGGLLAIYTLIRLLSNKL